MSILKKPVNKMNMESDKTWIQQINLYFIR